MFEPWLLMNLFDLLNRTNGWNNHCLNHGITIVWPVIPVAKTLSQCQWLALHQCNIAWWCAAIAACTELEDSLGPILQTNEGGTVPHPIRGTWPGYTSAVGKGLGVISPGYRGAGLIAAGGVVPCVEGICWVVEESQGTRDVLGTKGHFRCNLGIFVRKWGHPKSTQKNSEEQHFRRSSNGGLPEAQTCRSWQLRLVMNTNHGYYFSHNC